jgi:voltage-gated potassium channel
MAPTSGHRLAAARLAVWLTAAVALLSVVTGIANVGTTQLTGPLADVVPVTVQRTAGFTGTLTGFLMVASALGMRRRLRAAWYSTALLLPVTMVQGVAQASVVSLPLVALSALSLPTVALSRRQFDRELDLTTTQLAAATALVTVQAYGTAGAYALREEFTGVATLVDAFYFTLVTASTVGYGDVTPQSPVARLFGMSVVVLGTASFAVALGALLGPLIEARLATALGRMSERQLDLLDEHVIVLGYGDLTEPILQELEGQVEFVVVTPDATVAAQLDDRGFNVLTADPSDEDPLLRARIEDARAVVAATNDDAQDALAVLTARSLAPEARIVAAVTERENVDKLRRAGADTVISPAVIGGHLLVESALGGDRAEAIAARLAGDEGEEAVEEGGDDAAGEVAGAPDDGTAEERAPDGS